MIDSKLMASRPEDAGVDSEALEAVFARARREVDDGLIPSAQVAVARQEIGQGRGGHFGGEWVAENVGVGQHPVERALQFADVALHAAGDQFDHHGIHGALGALRF